MVEYNDDMYPQQPQRVVENSNLITASQDYSSVLIFALDPKPIIDELIHQLKNEIFDTELNVWKKLGDPLLNDAGISRFISMIRPQIDITITLSTFTEEEIMNKMREFAHGIKILLQKHYNDFGIPNLIVATNIRIMTCNIVHGSLNKAKGGMTLKIIGQTEKRIEQFGNKHGGGIGKLLPNL